MGVGLGGGDALLLALGVGDGEGLGEGEGVGDGIGLGLGVGTKLGVANGVGVGSGVPVSTIAYTYLSPEWNVTIVGSGCCKNATLVPLTVNGPSRTFHPKARSSGLKNATYAFPASVPVGN